MKYLNLLTTFLLIAPTYVFGITYTDEVRRETIHSVFFQGKDKQDPFPVLFLNTTGVLHLSFDDFSPDIRNLSYTIVHCNYDWQPSDLMQNQYLEGVFFDYILDIQTSQNTYKPFIHYRLDFPNEEVRPTISGNYALVVYEDGDENNIVLVRRFFVVDYKVTIGTDIHRPTFAKFYNTHQEVDFKVNTAKISVLNVHTDFKVMLRQNGRWDNAITDLQPRFISGSDISYNYEEENLFEATNEYRAFDTRQARFGGQMLQRVFQDTSGIFNAILYADKARNNAGHSFIRDLNGHRIIAATNVMDNDLESDYIKVYFRFLSTNPFESDLYVLGSFCDWQLNENNRLVYNEEKRWYETALLLKQGFYNYAYVTKNKDGSANFDQTEGNYFETENEYELFFYRYDVQLNYDMLVGYKRVNTMRGQKDY